MWGYGTNNSRGIFFFLQDKKEDLGDWLEVDKALEGKIVSDESQQLWCNFILQWKMGVLLAKSSVLKYSHEYANAYVFKY